MSTLKQSLYRKKKFRKPSLKYKTPNSVLTRTPILKRCPQAKGTVERVVTRKPKKPNSAVRHVAKIDLNNGLRLTARLPGKELWPNRYNRILVSGGRANDLPGIGYRAIRGVYDFASFFGKKKRRSIYGVSRPSGFTKHIRRCDRK